MYYFLLPSSRPSNTLLHLTWRHPISHRRRLLHQIWISPLLDRRGLEGVVLEFPLRPLLRATHFDEDDDDGREHDQEDDRNEDCLEQELDEAHAEMLAVVEGQRREDAAGYGVEWKFSRRNFTEMVAILYAVDCSAESIELESICSS